MPHTVYLIRHGESELNVHQPVIIGGRSRWCELTGPGIAQAETLGRWLGQSDIAADRIVASTAVRAQQTARYALAEAGIPLKRIETFTELEELDQGDWENELREETYTPEVLARINVDNWAFSPPGGESLGALFARTSAWLDDEVLAGPDGVTLVFCHGMVIKILLTGLFGFDRRTAWRIPIDNTAINTIVHDGAEWRLVGQNELPHLS
ncbi:MAG: broad specificity phosphatase PhoE [Myxococcota bacterium]